VAQGTATTSVINSAILRLNWLVTLDPDLSCALDFMLNSGSINLLDSADCTADITDRDAEVARSPADGLARASFEGGNYESLLCADCSGSSDGQHWL
jgi:hypothetical protein